jgi:ornithine cyclodeaminase
MRDGDILILKGEEVRALLDGKEREIIRSVKKAYEAHGNGKSSLPHSTFLRFPDEPGNRVIALPAYLGGEFEVAGIKWVSSFPHNLRAGLDRASAVIVLNSPRTGRPEAIIEGSVINAKRTAASAALAALHLACGPVPDCAGVIGCGLINFEIVRFLVAEVPGLSRLNLYDLNPARAEHFRRDCLKTFDGLAIEIARDARAVLASTTLVSIATTAGQPYISDLSPCPPGTTVLGISLRDLSPEAILSYDNVVDDVDHVCRAQTSVHLAEQQVGGRDFIRCTLADVFAGRARPRSDKDVTVFSPFGLGILDLAVGKLARDLSLQQNLGTVMDSFLPRPWDGHGADH